MELLIHCRSLKELFAFRENNMFAISIMEKGDKPKTDKPKAKAKAKAKQMQKQEQKQSVKIVIGEKAKPKRKYVRKAKVIHPAVNIVRGQTAVSYLGADGDLNQVISMPQAKQPVFQQTQQKPPTPPPQPPVLSSTQAPTTLDSELTAVSELVYPKARTPAFSEVQQPVPKKKTKAKAKSTLIKIGEGIGDFIKKNLLDQPLDLHTQEPSRAVEKPRPPLVIQPESKPIKPGKAKVEEIYMEVGEKPVVPSKTRKPVKSKTDVPVSVVFDKEIEREEMGREDINAVKKEEKTEKLVEREQSETITKPYKSFDDKEYERYLELKARQQKGEKLRDIDERFVYWEDYKRRLLPDQQEPTEVISLQDEAPMISTGRVILDTIDDIISTIETPIFSQNPDFKTISQNVDIENAPASQLDFGDEGLTQFNIDGFVPVGRQEGMVEVIEKKKAGRPKKYEDPEVAKRIKAEQTKESNRRKREERSKEQEQMLQEDILATGERLNEEWDEFNALEQSTDNLRTYIERKRQERKQEEESPYTFEKQFPNAPQIFVAQPFNELGEYAGSVLIKDVARKIVNKRNAEAYDANFISGDFQEQSADLWGSNNFGGLKPMFGEPDIGYADEDPVLSTATFSKDPVDSNLPFLGINDIEFL